jgi:hypothetical protein
MAWDSARPVPWKRFVKEGTVFALGMSAVLLLFTSQRDPGSFTGVAVGACMYVLVAGLLGKFGYVRKTLREMRAEAAAAPPRQVGRTPAARQRPAPTSRTNGGKQRR